jgi:hypothetical protein
MPVDITKLTDGTRVRFLRPDGAVVEDIVRGGVFQQMSLLEPYGPNEYFPAVVLTHHSWIAADQITEIL